MFKNFYAPFIFFALILFSSGCSTLCNDSKSYNPDLTWETRHHQLSTLNQWKITGTLSIRSPKKSFSSHVVWQQKDINRYTITLFGPLGIDTVKMSGQKKVFIFQTSRGQLIKSTSPEQLLDHQFGWNIPLSHLYYWIRGIPAPKNNYQLTWDSYHRLKTLDQSHWKIHYLEYQIVYQQDLPKVILLQNNLITVHVVINSWDFQQV